MGATRNTGYLENLIQYDASDNVGIATAVNPSYKVTLGGSLFGTSGRFTTGISAIGQEQAITFQRTTGTASDVYSFNADSGSAYLYNNTTAKPLMVWAEGGNVGIGTSPSEALHVYSSGTSPRPALFLETASASGTPEVRLFQTSGRAILMNLQTNGDWSFQNSANNSTYNPRMTITSGGNVGIGTPSPSHPLQVNNPTGNFNTISMINNSSNLARLAFVQNGSTTLAYTAIEGDGRSTGYLAFRTDDTERMRITSGGRVIVGTNSSNALEVFSDGDTEIGFSYATRGNVYAKIIGDITNASPLGGEIAFQTATGGTLSERMRITSGGRVGIGLNDPDVALVVAGSTNVASRIRASKTSSGVIEIGADRDTFNSPYISAITNSNLDFFTNDSHRMRITSTGVVAFNGSSSPNSGGIDKFSLGFENGVDGWIQTWGGRPLSLNSQGNPVLIGTRTNSAVGALEVVGGIYSQGIITITFAGVNLTANTPLYWNNSNGRVGINTSSKRYKTDIVSLTKEQAEFALKLNPVEYTRIETGERELGFIAEEVKEAGLGLIVPEMDGEVITVDYAKLSVIAIAMIKEQQKQIEELKSKLS